MRRIWILFFCVALLVIPVSAFSGITSAQNHTIVDSDGSCEVTLTVTLQLDHAVSDLVFPLPSQARDITVNGSSAKSTHAGATRNVSLSNYVAGAGTYTLLFRYALPDAVTADKKDNLFLTLELLSGFDYSVEALSFSITLPGKPESDPVFTSVYHQETVDSLMTLTVQDSVISGTVNQRLQDHETLTMTLAVSEEMFPQSMSKRWSMDTVDLLMIGWGLLAAIYWFLTMRTPLPRRIRRTAPPEGITAGELGCHLNGRGVDFTMMVISWAQMGYILIQPDDNGRVLLHKRMDMGNERSDFENRYFRSLFGKRRTVDGTGYHYARLCRKVMHSKPGIQEYFLRSSGSPLVFRVLAAAIGTLSGISLAAAFATDTLWRIVLSILLGALGSVVSWLVQSAAMTLHNRSKTNLWLGAGSAVIWYFLSSLAGEWNVALCVLPMELLAGLGAAYGGRRTDIGKQAVSDILGLRRYLRTIPKEELRRILKTNPHYYYDMAPYALALNTDRAFARQLGGMKLPECSYLTTGMDGHLTAREWNQLLRDTVNSLDYLQKRLSIDKLLGRS